MARGGPLNDVLQLAAPHTFMPVQTWGPAQVPQERTVRGKPQLSLAATVPQFLARREQKAASDSAMQPQELPETAPQLCGALHVPHEMTVRGEPQLSLAAMVPQFLPKRAQNVVLSSATQPQTLLALHVCGAAQVPQETTVLGAPQLS
jgi:hypothetical protein